MKIASCHIHSLFVPVMFLDFFEFLELSPVSLSELLPQFPHNVNNYQIACVVRHHPQNEDLHFAIFTRKRTMLIFYRSTKSHSFPKKIIVFNQRNGSKNLPHLTSRNFQRIALANVVHTELLYRRVPFVAPRFEELTIASNLRRHTFLNFSDRFISLLCAICMNFNT